MSERGSFVTEFIYCDHCLEKLEAVLVDGTPHGPGGKYLRGARVCTVEQASGKRRELPIIAGKFGSCGGPGSDLIMFQFDLFTPANAPCHPVRVALLADSGANEIVRVLPNGEVGVYVTNTIGDTETT